MKAAVILLALCVGRSSGSIHFFNAFPFRAAAGNSTETRGNNVVAQKGRLGEKVLPSDPSASVFDPPSEFGDSRPTGGCTGVWCERRQKTRNEIQAGSCISGRDRTTKSGNLCEFSCRYGFCLESLCECTARGARIAVPGEREVHVAAKDDADRDLNHLCQFSCKYGNCPEDVCTIRARPQPDYPVDYRERVREESARKCFIYKEPKHWEAQKQRCELACSKELEQARKEGRTFTAICVGFWPLDKPIPWQKLGEEHTVALGTCYCYHQQ
ncbi:uncharacterized protein GLRG_09772 [Colletotrichum graminicola M1.001]|uniref:Uncharacterized protein n=1 Tax=Colletotrichum graminicola (strain M1.001 / M2 / FGSC 10212) TaxID=645133 RepID=E3QUU0_COLGM|nr:uncharacterized protein GLRG_09772 [Colletotrichum graminicola M1.001]EFQ34628.1 hypothetical protein GLRG_09772 [Colletotrichum graminicola M1.001]